MILISENNYNQKGFGIIEVLIGIAIFSIGFMAISSAIWSSSRASRTAYYSSASILNGEDFIEYTSLLPDKSGLIKDNKKKSSDSWIADPGYELQTNGDDITAKWNIINENDNFRTIDLRIYQILEKDSDGNALNQRLRMRTVYRQEIL